MKAKDLKVGMKVVVTEFGQRKAYELTNVQHFPRLGPRHGQEFIALGTNEWDKGVPGLGATFDLDEEIEVEI